MTPREWAHAYIDRGCWVLPLYPVRPSGNVLKCSCPDRIYKIGPDPAKWKCSPGKHPFSNLQHGVKDATNDHARADLWWGPQMWPDAGIAIALVPSGLLDIAPDGVADLADFIARGLPDTATFRSGGGEGHQHFLYRLPAGAPQARLCLPKHYDILSDGYCVTPETLHESGGRYEWLDFDRDFAEPPTWALELLIDHVNGRTPAATVNAPGAAILGVNGEPPVEIDRDVWAGAGAADRSGGLWAIAGEMAQAGANEETIVEALRERDETLGWAKFTNRKDRETRYRETARRQLANAMPRIHLNGTSTAASSPTATIVPPDPKAHWPAPLEDAAFHGPLGTVVRGIEPHSEADVAALLAHALAIAGAYVGPRVHARAGDMPHPPRFFGAIVGDTSKGRKGTSAAPFRASMTDADYPVRIASGLSSAEGLVHQVRDCVEKWNAKKQAYEIVDPGINDKRLVIIEGELATLLRRMEREGNAISATLRDVWDTGNLETLVKQNPTRATGAHINVVAHITFEELREYLHPTEVSSGFANRFLWFAAKRSKFLPRGGNAPQAVLVAYATALDRAREWILAESIGELDWSADAGAQWDVGYPELSAGVMGLYGQATQRAEAQVLRLAVLYAALDCSTTLELAHLEAGLAVWRYCNDSARWIFGARTGNPTADTIIAALRANGEMTRSDISNLFHRNTRADKIGEGLGLLLKHQLAAMDRRGGGAFIGRPTEYWRAL